MYGRSAHLYDALYHFKDYASESAQIRAWIRKRRPEARTLLDVGCGTGRHVEHLRAWYSCEGVDINPELLARARARCPDVTFHQADMLDFDLGSSFDVVTCLFSAVAGAAKSRDELCRAVQRLARHVRPSGLLIVEPWFTPEQYRTGTITANFVNSSDLKIAWMYHSLLEGRTAVSDVHYLVGTPTSIEHFTELLRIGLFSHDDCVQAFEAAGLRVEHDPQGFGRGIYFGSKPYSTP